MQSLSTQSPEAINVLEDSKHRVRAMAFVHERLFQAKDLTSINVYEYLESLARYLLAAYEPGTNVIRLNLQVSNIYLDLDTAIASGLIVNELVSNALKHAFPSTWKGEGEIGVKFSMLDDHWFQLQIMDNGVGFPPDLVLDGVESLGLRLVTMLSQQLQGTLELCKSPGTTLTITFPGAERPPAKEASQR
jgi:two-component sensor histidine kinase